MNPSIISLIPPFVLFVVASFTGDVLKAFAVGIVAALLIIAHAKPFLMVSLLIKQIVAYISDPNVILLFLFLVGIGAIIVLLSTIRTRGANQKQTNKSQRSVKMAEYTGALFSFLFGIDDYLSILIVGFFMRQLAEKYAISKERVAYFVHALSGPLVIMIPISSWAAEIVSQLYQAGVHAAVNQATIIKSDPLFLYMKSMGYNFYSIFTILSVLFFIQTQKQMYKIPSLQKSKDENINQEGKFLSVLDIGIPLVLLLFCTFFGLLYTGGFYVFGGNNSFFQALQNTTSTFLVLCISGLFAFGGAFIYQFYKGRVNFFEIWHFCYGGFDLMKSAMAMIFLASIFGSFVRRDLLTGVYVAQVLLAHISHAYIPFVAFVTSLLVSMVIGTAWGTFALMIPIVLQMLLAASGFTGIIVIPEQIPFLLPSLGAIFAGGVCGNHLSLFAETTAMTASSIGITPIHHVKSQLFYAIPAVITASLLYASIGFLHRVVTVSLPLLVGIGSILCLVSTLFLWAKICRND